MDEFFEKLIQSYIMNKKNISDQLMTQILNMFQKLPKGNYMSNILFIKNFYKFYYISIYVY